MTHMAETQESPEGGPQALDHDRPAQLNHDQETEQCTISRNRSSAEQRRLDALQRLESISLKPHNRERTALHIVSQEGATLEHAGRRLKESLDAVIVRTVVGKQGVIYSECAPNFKERRRAAELIVRLHECLRGPNARIEELDVFAENQKVDPLIEKFQSLDNVDRMLYLQALELSLTMIEYRKQDICKQRYNLTLEELEAQLHEEAANQVIAETSAADCEPRSHTAS
jgi:hypothetical protein